MYGVELYAAVRLAVVEEGLSHREAGRRFGIDRRTVKKMLRYSAPPGYRRTNPGQCPYVGVSEHGDLVEDLAKPHAWNDEGESRMAEPPDHDSLGSRLSEEAFRRGCGSCYYLSGAGVA